MIQYQLKSKHTEPNTFNLGLSLSSIVFMGTAEFAVASLEALIKSGFNIAAVVTAPDKPAGRGLKLTESPIKKFASKKGLRILQPEKLKNPDFLDGLRSINAQLQVVVAFRMLPEVIWSMPSKGTINLHGSLLPQYRGAAPINWAVINGEKETGLTTFKLQQEIDTGNILMQQTISIGDDETAGELHERMKEAGAQLLVETVKGVLENTSIEIPQQSLPESGIIKVAPKILTETCRINWQKSLDEIHNLVRGLSPYPAAFTELADKNLKIFRSEKEPAVPTSRIGSWETDRRSFLKYACSNGYIHLKEVQIEGKKRMSIEEFLRGYRFN